MILLGGDLGLLCKLSYYVVIMASVRTCYLVATERTDLTFHSFDLIGQYRHLDLDRWDYVSESQPVNCKPVVPVSSSGQ